MLSQAQDSVEAAEDLAQEVRDPLALHPRQATARVSHLRGGDRPALGTSLGQLLGGNLGRKRGRGAPGLAGALPWLRLGGGTQQERGLLAPPGDLSPAPGAAQPGRAAGAVAKTPRRDR